MLVVPSLILSGCGEDAPINLVCTYQGDSKPQLFVIDPIKREVYIDGDNKNVIDDVHSSVVEELAINKDRIRVKIKSHTLSQPKKNIEDHTNTFFYEIDRNTGKFVGYVDYNGSRPTDFNGQCQ